MLDELCENIREYFLSTLGSSKKVIDCLLCLKCENIYNVYYTYVYNVHILNIKRAVGGISEPAKYTFNVCSYI